MQRINRRRLLLLVSMFAVVFAFGCGGGHKAEETSVAANATITGEIWGTLDGEPFTRYTVEDTVGKDMHYNSASYDRTEFAGVFDFYDVSLQGHRTARASDFDHALSIGFQLDALAGLEVHTWGGDEPPEVSYFPEGIVFSPERMFRMSEGTLDVTYVEMEGDVLKVRGEFAGTLVREKLDMTSGEVTVLESKEITGEFDIQKVSYDPI